MAQISIGVVGNPNSGKSTLFNLLTGAKQTVGNWPGVTVDRKTGVYKEGGRKIEVVDTPGIYSLVAASIDEKVASEYVLSGDYNLIINIVDASNIERNLYLTSQLLEMKVPLVVVLNMMDVAAEKRLTFDVQRLEEQLGCPVVPVTASRGKGMEALLKAIDGAAGSASLPVRIQYPKVVRLAIDKLSSALAEEEGATNSDTEWTAIKLLEGDELVSSKVSLRIIRYTKGFMEEIEEELDEDADIVIASARYDFIAEVVNSAVRKTGEVSSNLSDKIDRIVLSKVFGLPIFFGAMYLMFMFTINFGGAFIDFFDILFGTLCVDWYGQRLAGFGAPVWLIALLANGMGGGVQTIATFIPPIGFMFLALSFLEDSGYMARAAFVMDRAMRIIGLPGKAFIPMLVGFGCNVPAIMATRTMENQRDRTLAILMNPFMSCGARLPVYVLFAAAFFPGNGQNLVFMLYLIGIAFAVLTGVILKNTLLAGEVTPFVMELPPYHLPSIKGVFLRAWERLTTFLFRAGKVLMPVILVLSFLNSIGPDGSFGNEDADSSVLATIGKSITPIFGPMGITEQNWPATVGIFTGVFAKEAVVGTLDALYDSGSAVESDAEESVDIMVGVQEALATIPANLADLTGTMLDPFGISAADVGSVGEAAGELEVSVTTFSTMNELFGSKSAAIAYLLFVLLYFPCSAAIAAVYREINMGWTVFVASWTTGLAYLVATVYFQLATLALHPASSIIWVFFALVYIVLIFMIMREFGEYRNQRRFVRPGRVRG
jgi:ferrous iron transport protein B